MTPSSPTPSPPKAGAIKLDAFVATAKSDGEKEELQANFHDFDKSLGGEADGVLTFRKFATGTTTCTPLGRMKDAAFEKTVGAMIQDAKEAHAKVGAVNVS